jgi:asparagine synthase (glutamine-hydrolysing)
MCGIVGYHKVYNFNTSLIQRQLDLISHRGPDDNGFWFDESDKVCIGSRRLAIQDLSSNGKMPFVSKDERYIIVFNGEVYNYLDIKKELLKNGYEFISNTDTEVVLYAYIHWGVSCLNYFVGMFAFAIYDKYQKQFFLARDRVGEKPLYYSYNDFGFTFGSELKQLLADNDIKPNINYSALQEYLQDGYVRQNKSFVESVHKLPAAHYFLYNIITKKIEINKYWNLPKYKANDLSSKELINHLDVLMHNSVKKQMISDVPLGVLLSGGVDSSLITSYAASISSEKVKTFHISFEGFGKYNESEYAKKVANYFDTEHTELSGNEIQFNLIDDLLNYFDEPLADSSMIPTYLVSKLTKQNVTVALGGDGGDELFGGYTTYREAIKSEDVNNLLTQSLREITYHLAKKMPVGLHGRNYLMNLRGDVYDKFLNNKIFDNYIIKDVINKKYLPLLHSKTPTKQIIKTSNIIEDISGFDFHNYLCDDILVKVDRASMAFSLELRAPFLDKDVIEFAFGMVKSEYKVSKTDSKILLKTLLKKRMPIDFDLNRKQGFSIPLDAWISGKWYNDFFEEINNFPEILNKDFAFQMLLNTKKGYTNSGRLFSLLILSRWIKKYKINFDL